MKLKYPCYLTKGDNGDVILECFAPSITTFGTLEEAVADMHSIMMDLLGEAFEMREPFPLPETDGSHEGERIEVTLTATETLKIYLINAMIETGMRPIDLAERLNIARQEVTRIINPRYRTGLETLDRAIEATGKHVKLTIV